MNFFVGALTGLLDQQNCFNVSVVYDGAHTKPLAINFKPCK